jgi:hypothetical protein
MAWTSGYQNLNSEETHSGVGAYMTLYGQPRTRKRETRIIKQYLREIPTGIPNHSAFSSEIRLRPDP